MHGLVSALAATENVFVNTQDGHVLAAMGVENLVVVHTADATLVCTREAADGLKALVRGLGADPATARFVK